MSPALIEAQGITVRFGGLSANDSIDLDVSEGAIDAIIGPNGAGKSTLFAALSRAQPIDEGQITFGGVDVTDLSRLELARLGVARTFQTQSMSDALTCLESVTLGAGRFHRLGPFRSMLRLPGAMAHDRVIRATALESRVFVGLGDAAGRYPWELAYGERRRVEFARALAARPRLLLMDEPSSGMSPTETSDLVDHIRTAARQFGITVLVVEHDMAFVRGLAERTTVLDFGRVLASGPTAEVLADAAVEKAYLGV